MPRRHLNQLPLFAPAIDDDTAALTLASAPTPSDTHDACGFASSSSSHSRRASHGEFSLCILGSGSGGNCGVVRFGEHALLIDAGFGPATITRRLMQAGIELGHVRGVLLTHLDQDHFRPHWIKTLVGWNITVYLHHWHAADLRELDNAEQLYDAGLVRTFDRAAIEPLPGLTVSPVRLAHDRQGTTGYHLAHAGRSIAYATDLGHVPDELINRFAGVDVLAIESNYDPPMQLRSNRPLFLKRRIMGPAGHLSNQQSFEAVRRIVDASPDGQPRHIVLLHRSQQCNDPSIVREVFAQDKRVSKRVVLTEQRRRTKWFHTGARVNAITIAASTASTTMIAPLPAPQRQLRFGSW